MRKLSVALMLAMVAMVSHACTLEDPSCDHEVRCAEPIRANVAMLIVEDRIDADKDVADWKSFVAQHDGSAELKVIVGDPFDGRPHGLAGFIHVLDEEANPLVKTSIHPSEFKYQLRWEVKEGVKYLIKFGADRRGATYALKLSVEAPPAPPTDPCDEMECEPDEICRRGACVPTGDCSPPCGRGKRCVDGDCVGARCPGGCGRGERCKKKRGKWRCIKDPCYKKNCPSGTRCRGGECVGGGEEPPPPPSWINAKITNTEAAGGGAMVTLNKGRGDGVKKGANCRACGASGFIREVYGRRARCKIARPVSTCHGKRSGRIKVK